MKHITQLIAISHVKYMIIYRILIEANFKKAPTTIGMHSFQEIYLFVRLFFAIQKLFFHLIDSLHTRHGFLYSIQALHRLVIIFSIVFISPCGVATKIKPPPLCYVLLLSHVKNGRTTNCLKMNESYHKDTSYGGVKIVYLNHPQIYRKNSFAIALYIHLNPYKINPKTTDVICK